jgi:Double zinc ribbon
MGQFFNSLLADAVVYTLMFIVLVLGALDISRLVRAHATRVPESGNMILLATLLVVVAIAYRAYQGVIPPLLGDDANLYNWLALVLGLLPLGGLIFIGYRNLDLITDAAFNSTRRAVAASAAVSARTNPNVCSGCGKPLSADAKFCGSCGTVAATVAVATPPIYCSTCGAKNDGGAGTCISCGKPLAAGT